MSKVGVMTILGMEEVVGVVLGQDPQEIITKEQNLTIRTNNLELRENAETVVRKVIILFLLSYSLRQLVSDFDLVNTGVRQ